MARTPAVELTRSDYRRAASISRDYREQHSLTQMALAVQLKARLADISAIENGHGDRSSRIVQAILNLA